MPQRLATGRANLNLLKMARPGLSLSLRTAIHTARKEHRRVTKEGIQVQAFDKTSSVRLSVIPLTDAEFGAIVTFAKRRRR